MKTIKYVFAAVLTLLAIGCSEEETSDNTHNYAPVKVHVNDFSMLVDDFSTRAEEMVANYTDVGAITLAFYNGTTEVYKHTQLRSDNTTFSTFGEFSCNLPLGNYTMVVIGRGYFDGDEFSLTSPTSAGYTSERVRETFSATQTVNITSTDAVELSATLNRVIAQLLIRSTDARIDGVSKIRTTYAAGGKSFSPSTGLATSNTGFAVTNTPSAAVGTTIGVGSFLFLASDQQSVNVTIEVLDEDNQVMFTKSVPNVPMQRNKQTTLTGPVFTTTAPTTSSFKIEADWLEGTTVPF